MARGSYYSGFAPRDGQPRFPELWRGCVGAWAPCLGPSGLVLRDWSPFHNDGTLTNMAADSDWVIDGGRHCLDLDGANDIVSIPNGAQYGTSDISYGGWVKKRSTSEGGYLISKNNDGSASGPSILLGASGALTVHANAAFVTTSAAYIATEWSHIWVNFRSLVIEVYYNGVLRDTSTARTGIGTSWPNTIPIVIGSRTASSVAAAQFDGQFDDMRWYNRALSANEVSLLARRRGIAYEMELPRRYTEQAAAAAARARLLMLLGVGR